MSFLPARFNPLLLRTFLTYLGLSLILLVLPTRWASPARQTVAYPLVLAQQATLQSARGAEPFFGIVRRWHDEREISDLRNQVVELQAQLSAEVERRNAAESRVAQYERLPVETRQRTIGARVAAYDASVLRRTVTLDKGSRAGVVVGCPVFWNGAAAGRVESVGPWTCRAILAGDPNCRIAVRDERTRVQGVLVGVGGGMCRVSRVARDADVAKGDNFVTSGTDEAFPSGHPVGRCAAATDESGELYMNVEVRPFLDMMRMENVLILLPNPAEGS